MAKPTWHPDGARLLYASITGKPAATFWQPTDGSGTPTPHYDAPLDVWPAASSRVGVTMAFAATGAAIESANLFILGADGNRRLVAGGPGVQDEARFSPDRKWIDLPPPRVSGRRSTCSAIRPSTAGGSCRWGRSRTALGRQRPRELLSERPPDDGRVRDHQLELYGRVAAGAVSRGFLILQTVPGAEISL